MTDLVLILLNDISRPFQYPNLRPAVQHVLLYELF